MEKEMKWEIVVDATGEGDIKKGTEIVVAKFYDEHGARWFADNQDCYINAKVRVIK